MKPSVFILWILFFAGVALPPCVAWAGGNSVEVTAKAPAEALRGERIDVTATVRNISAKPVEIFYYAGECGGDAWNLLDEGPLVLDDCPDRGFRETPLKVLAPGESADYLVRILPRDRAFEGEVRFRLSFSGLIEDPRPGSPPLVTESLSVNFRPGQEKAFPRSEMLRIYASPADGLQVAVPEGLVRRVRVRLVNMQESVLEFRHYGTHEDWIADREDIRVLPEDGPDPGARAADCPGGICVKTLGKGESYETVLRVLVPAGSKSWVFKLGFLPVGFHEPAAWSQPVRLASKSSKR